MESNLGFVGEQSGAGRHPYTAFLAEQADLIDVPHLIEALTWLGVSTPEGGTEAAAARLGHLVNYLTQRVLQGKVEHQQRAEAARAQHGAGQPVGHSPAERRAFNAGRAFAERIARAEQNARRSAVLRIAVEARAELDADAEDLRLELHEIVRTIDPHLAELSCADARRALNALQPD